MMFYKNPLLTRLLSRQAPVPIQLLAGAAAGLGVSVLGSLAIYNSRLELAVLLVIIHALGGMYFFVPPLTTAAAAVMTSADIGTEQYQLLRLTAVSDRAIFMGYTWAALCRLSIPLLIMAGSMAILLQLLVSYAGLHPYVTPLQLFLLPGCMVGVLAFILPAAVWGVGAAFYARKRRSAILAASLICFCVFPVLVILPAFLYVLILGALVLLTRSGYPSVLFLALPLVMCVVLPAMSGLLTLFLIQRAAPLARRGFSE
jgi:hypothetical protein